MKVQLLTVLTLFYLCCCQLSLAAPKKKSKCKPLLRTADEAYDKIFMVTDKNFKAFETLEQFDDLYCKKSNEWREDVSRYKKCLRPFPAQIFAMVINNMKKTWKTFCFSEENKNTAFNHLKCVTPETHPKFQEAGYMIISMVDYVSRLKDLDEAIPSLCCGAHKLVARIEKHLEATCSTVGKKGSGKWMTEAAWSMLSDTMDMLCGNYENIADCHSKVPEIVAKVEAATKSEAISNSTVVTPFVRLIKRLDKQLTGQ